MEKTFRRWEQDPKDLLEAILTCGHCGGRFPVVCGIPILFPDTPKYLRQHHHFIVGSCRALRVLSAPMENELMQMVLQDLDRVDEELFPPQLTYSRRGILEFLTQVGPYLCNHYDDLATVVDPHDPLFPFLRGYAERNPQVVLERFLRRRRARSGGLAVDVGCHVGGMLARLATRCRKVVGVDLAFEHLLLAGRILLGRPRRLTRYRLYREGLRYERRRLRVPPCDSVELVAASGCSLPFRDGLFEIASSCNLVDVVPRPFDIVDEQLRVLEAGGLFLTSDPYQFHGARMARLKSRSRRSPVAIVKDRLARSARIVEEEDFVPWITRTYDRHHSVYSNHCLAAVKHGGRNAGKTRSPGISSRAT